MGEEKKIELQEMIRALRKQGFSQQAIAFAVNVNQSTINRILSGKYQNPRHTLALNIQSLFSKYCQDEMGSFNN